MNLADITVGDIIYHTSHKHWIGFYSVFNYGYSNQVRVFKGELLFVLGIKLYNLRILIKCLHAESISIVWFDFHNGHIENLHKL